MTSFITERARCVLERSVGPCFLAALAASTVAHAAGSVAQGYPARPIRLIVPQSPGGSIDVVARIVVQRLADALGEPVIVDYRPGAGSVSGSDLVAKAAPDGYTLLAVAASFTINPSLRKILPFDPVRDFVPLTRLAVLPHVLVVHPSVPAKSVQELIALIKSKPGRINYASSGIATSTHLAAELFKHMTDTDMVNVAYKGGAPAMVAMLAGECQVNFAAISAALPQVRNGKLRALAVTTRKRSVVAPELPTVAESGVPGYDHSSWVGTLAPARTPHAVAAKLHAETVKIVQAPETRALLLRDGLEALGDTPGEFSDFIKADLAKWAKVVKAAGIKAE